VRVFQNSAPRSSLQGIQPAPFHYGTFLQAV